MEQNNLRPFSDRKTDLERIYKRLRDAEDEDNQSDMNYHHRYSSSPDMDDVRLENDQLKSEIESLRKTVNELSKTNSSSKLCGQKLVDAQAEVDLYRKQSEELRKLLLAEQKKSDRFKDPENFVARISALDDRLKEFQRENFELRRQLAGLTPERLTGYETSPSVSRCVKCVQISKQKAHQAKYFETKLINARKLADDYHRECKHLREQMDAMQKTFNENENRLESILQKQKDNVSIYKSRNDRLERQNISQLKGLETDVESIKSKLSQIEKALLKTQLTLVGDDVRSDLTKELHILSNRSKFLDENLKRLQQINN